MEFSLSFGHWIQQRRKALGLTQVDLAQRVGCAVVTLKKIEQDTRKPSLDLAELLADHLLIPSHERERFLAAARGVNLPSLATLMVASQDSATRADEVRPQPTRPFVSRQRELAELQKRLDQALAGQSQIVFVTGEAGSGKSTLLLEFAQRAQIRQRSLVVAGGSCNAFSGGGDPYLPFRDALLMLLGEMDGPWANALAAQQSGFSNLLLPHLARALLNCGPDVIDVLAPASLLLQRLNAVQPTTTEQWPRQLRELIAQQRARATQPDQKQLFEQIRLVFETIARSQPLLLLLDDLQWADTASLNLLFHWGQRLTDSRLLLIAAFRPSEVLAWRSREEPGADQHPLLAVRNELVRRLGEIEISLEHGTATDGRTFVDALLDAEPNKFDPSFREQLFNRTGGYPLFTVELLRTLQERHDLIKDATGQWMVAGALNWAALPTRVEAVIEQRIKRMPSHLQELLKIASIMGEEFTAEVVARVFNEPIPVVIQQLSNLIALRYRLVESSGVRRLRTQRLSQYHFQHNLFQHYLYSHIDEAERMYWHEAVGNVMEAIYAEDAESLAAMAVQLAQHFLKADIPAKAIPYLLLAGKRAVQFSAYENAIAHFEQGLRLLALLPPNVERDQQELELAVALGTALMFVRGTAVARVGEMFHRALILAEQSGNKEQQALALFNLWRFYSDRADYQQCSDIAGQLQRLAEQSDNPAVHLTADHALWTMSLYAGDFVRARYHAEQGIAWYRPELHHALTAVHAGHDPGMCCRIFAAYALWYLGYPDQARRSGQDAISLARRVAHSFSLAMALTLTAEVHLLCREYKAAQVYIQEALALAKTHGFTSWLELGAIFQGWALAQAGQADEGIKLMLYGLDANRAMVGEASGLHCFAQLADAYGKAGQPAAGLALLEKALDTSDKSKLRHWTQWQSELYRLQGELSLQQPGQASLGEQVSLQIEAYFQEAIAIAQQQQAKSTELRATLSLSRFWIQQGKRAEADQQLSSIYAWFTEGFDTPDLQEAKLLLDQLYM
ncbi:MAG: AAA family ATPase [Caldilineaceae bacterium]